MAQPMFVYQHQMVFVIRIPTIVNVMPMIIITILNIHLHHFKMYQCQQLALLVIILPILHHMVKRVPQHIQVITVNLILFSVMVRFTVGQSAAHHLAQIIQHNHQLIQRKDSIVGVKR